MWHVIKNTNVHTYVSVVFVISTTAFAMLHIQKSCELRSRKTRFKICNFI